MLVGERYLVKDGEGRDVVGELVQGLVLESEMNIGGLFRLEEDSKGGTRYHEEVAGDDGRRVILEKGRPTVITARVPGRCDREFWQIFPDGARRYSQAELHQQLVGNPLRRDVRVLWPSCANRKP
jgi:hypothetical protein